MTAPAAPRLRPEEKPSHGDILLAIENLRGDFNLLTLAHQGTQREVEKVSGAVKDVSDSVGWTDKDEHGHLIGKGLLADVARLSETMNAKFRWLDSIRLGAVVAGAVIAAAAAVVWWLARPDVERVFHERPAAEAKK